MEAWLKDKEEDWCPNMRDLTVGIQSSDVVELERMEDLAAFLKRREELGRVLLETLVVRKVPGAIDFPYVFATTNDPRGEDDDRHLKGPDLTTPSLPWLDNSAAF
ncbi:hypothetical protein BKA70DRAFT_1409683 [Coprinopsis sp. MPI-PUGE-AT-0042]|nr:hypothetical protein BKA70DRAFT_1409683 [Coprinopsis sp. MPI-PUGE-AT-0042]